MDKENTRGESHFACERHDFLHLLRRTRANDAADGNSKTGVITQPPQALLKIRENLLRRFIGLNSINGNLHFLESGLIQFLDQIRSQEKAVGNHARAEEAKLAAFANQTNQVRVEHRFAASQRYPERTQAFQLLKTFYQNRQRDRVAYFVVFGAITARKITAADDNHLREERTVTEARKNARRQTSRGCGGILSQDRTISFHYARKS